MNCKIDIATLRRLLNYDPKTGGLVWLPRTSEMFKSPTRADKDCAAWNKKYAGKPAFTAVNRNGYRHGAIFGVTYTAHSVAWALTAGSWQVHTIDHINGDRLDNRASNLRDVPHSVNNRNMSANRRNTSGVMGVHFNRATGKWVASIKGGGRMTNLGYYSTIEEAAAVRREAEKRFDFHPNHGKRAA